MRADGEVLKTVLWNLLENAAKYSPDCDTIWVTLSRHRGEIALSVRDRGVGIPTREQREVFDKFVRGAGARASGVGVRSLRRGPRASAPNAASTRRAMSAWRSLPAAAIRMSPGRYESRK